MSLMNENGKVRILMGTYFSLNCVSLSYVVFYLGMFGLQDYTIGTIVSVSVFLLVGAPGIYHAFVNDLASRDSQIEQSKGTVLGGGDRDESESRWIFVTNWSMPPEDTLEFLVPRIHGDTSCPLTLSINRERGIVPYTGRLGRPVGSREGNYRQHSTHNSHRQR